MKIAQRDTRRVAYQFIIMMGMVSQFGDLTYEGARSVAGPFLYILGANAAVVGLVAGLGEFLGYALRLLSGYWADKSGRYWVFVFIGYALILAIPLLTLAGIWQVAAVFIIAERMGKAIRAPARDTILSYATKEVGRGWGFGIHEAMYQIGAVIGPLALSAVFFLGGGYRTGFGIMLIPALMTVGMLALARGKVPAPEQMERAHDTQSAHEGGKLPSAFWLYTVFAFLSVAGFAATEIIHSEILGFGAGIAENLGHPRIKIQDLARFDIVYENCIVRRLENRTVISLARSDQLVSPLALRDIVSINVDISTLAHG